MNDIQHRQNLSENLYKRAVIGELYSRAKKWLLWEIILTFIIGFFYSINVILLFLNCQNILIHLPHFSFVAPFLSIFFTLFDNYFIVRKINKLTVTAASIQDDLDSEIFSLPLNEFKINKYGYKSEEKIIDISKFKNWYDYNISLVPLEIGRIIAQEINCSWDYDLRNSFLKSLIIILGFPFIIISILFFSVDFSIESLLTCLFSLLYFLNFSLRYFLKNYDTQRKIADLNKKIDILWDKIISNTFDGDLTLISRQIQDELYDSRKTDALVLDCYYQFKKRNQQHDSKNLVKLRVNEYKNRESK